MRIVALDPGGTTGVAMYEEWADEAFTIAQIGPEDHHKQLFDLLFKFTDRYSIIVCESFEFRQGSQRANINLMSKEYIGVTRLYGKMYQLPVVLQTASMGKGFVSDDKLKVMGLYTPGQKHAMDAMRHLIYFMVVKQKRIDLTESWKTLV